MKNRMVPLIVLLLSSNAFSVTLDWDMVSNDEEGIPITDLTGYRVFQATSSFNQVGIWISTDQATNMPSITKYDVVGSTITSFTIDTLAPNTRYYFRLTAYNQSSLQSGFNVDASGNDTEVSTTTVSICDINGDGQVSVSDVQLDIDAALGVCTRVCDINKDGQCTVADVQKVINAILGGSCV